MKIHLNSLRKLRMEREILQKDFAKKIGISKIMLGMIERAEYRPTAANRRRIADGLGVTEQEAFGRAYWKYFRDRVDEGEREVLGDD